MKTVIVNPKKQNKIDIIKSILLCIPMTLLSLMFLTGGNGFSKILTEQISFLAGFIFVNTIFFLIIYTKKTYKYRKIFFITYAILFILTFMTHMLEVRGTIELTGSNIIQGKTPFCHIVIPMVIIPAAITKTIIFPGSLVKGFASIASMIVIWIAASLAFGRAWCSWVCFYGGLDEGFSCLCKKPKLKIDKKWTYLSFGVLIAIVLISATTLSPFYCQWLCPFKATTEFEQINSIKTFLQAVVFYSLFLVLVVILPILTGKRTQCSLFCPFGAFQSFTNKINIFDIRIDKANCINCKKCIRECPTYSIDEDSLEKGKTLITCTKCGKCIDICPKKSISYHIKGTKIGIKQNTARILFLYPVYLFAMTMGGGTIIQGINIILTLITTGKLF